MIKSLFTPDQIQDLREEFIEFEINDMSREEMASFIRNQKLKEYNLYDEDMLRQEIDEYDENLYEILASYVLDEPDSYYNMLDFMNDRRGE
jgi:hypothetical protein